MPTVLAASSVSFDCCSVADVGAAPAGAEVAAKATVGSGVVDVSVSEEEQAAAMRTIPMHTVKNRTMHLSLSFPRLYIACLGKSLIIDLPNLQNSCRSQLRVSLQQRGIAITPAKRHGTISENRGCILWPEGGSGEMESFDRRVI
jgi:hypothetical protein